MAAVVCVINWRRLDMASGWGGGAESKLNTGDGGGRGNDGDAEMRLANPEEIVLEGGRRAAFILVMRFIRNWVGVGVLLVIAMTVEGAPPQSEGSEWRDLIAKDLGNVEFPTGVWWWEGDELTASADEMIWTKRDYTDFDLDLEFKTADGTNSGVIIYVSNPDDWIPNSVEIQIADDFSAPWSKAPKTWQCGALFGRQAAAESRVKRPGEWNRMTISARGKRVKVLLNGAEVIDADLARWTSAKVNPDGSEIPEWLSKPMAELPTTGKIGLQGKHAGAPIWFRNLKVRVEAATK